VQRKAASAPTFVRRRTNEENPPDADPPEANLKQPLAKAKTTAEQMTTKKSVQSAAVMAASMLPLSAPCSTDVRSPSCVARAISTSRYQDVKTAVSDQNGDRRTTQHRRQSISFCVRARVRYEARRCLCYGSARVQCRLLDGPRDTCKRKAEKA